MTAIFLELNNVSVKSGGTDRLNQISLVIHRNEQWAIIGLSGSGMTLLANTIAGKNFYSGTIAYFFPLKKNGRSTIVMEDQLHFFKNLSNTQDLYYQQRFNSYDSEQTITVRQELKDHFSDEGFLQSEWLDELGIRELLNEPLIQLSNGENKRVQLVISLLGEPELLILDNPFIGLDAEGRQTLHHIIGSISQKGVQILLVCSVQELPESITHIAWLGQGKLEFAGKREDIQFPKTAPPPAKLDTELLQQLKPFGKPAFLTAFQLINVHVKYGDKNILSGIHWKVKKGERWNLTGPNGAGKSTLLSLITADNPQAYANEIYLFDRRRGSGESIWDIKQKIGFVSPELHVFFDHSATCTEVIASGLFDTIGLFRRLGEKQQQIVSLWLKLFQLENIQSKRLFQLSISEQRKTMLARALIKTPPLLILDEPCQGLDEDQTAYFKNLVDQICEAFDTTLVYVSHYQNQVPECVNHFFRLENGRAAIG
jgi:molybdate transport system ATP-binding protein